MRLAAHRPRRIAVDGIDAARKLATILEADPHRDRRQRVWIGVAVRDHFDPPSQRQPHLIAARLLTEVLKAKLTAQDGTGGDIGPTQAGIVHGHVVDYRPADEMVREWGNTRLGA